MVPPNLIFAGASLYAEPNGKADSAPSDILAVLGWLLLQRDERRNRGRGMGKESDE